MTQGQEGGNTPIKNKNRMKNPSQRGVTQGSSHAEQTTRETTEQVHA
jgi:hypothetical protein